MLGNHLYTAAMTIGPDRDALFNEVYETEHIPAFERVPGVRGVRRFRRIDPPERYYLAVYELDDPGVPSGAAWLEARDLGRWPTDVRPYTSGLQNGLFRHVDGSETDRPDRSPATMLVFARLPDAPGVDALGGQILARLTARGDVRAAAFYRELEGRPHLVVAAVEGDASDATEELASIEPEHARVGPIERYAPIGAADD